MSKANRTSLIELALLVDLRWDEFLKVDWSFLRTLILFVDTQFFFPLAVFYGLTSRYIGLDS